MAPAADPLGAWPCLVLARTQHLPRVPFLLLGERVGSVAQRHLEALRGIDPDLRVDDAAVALHAASSGIDASWQRINEALRERSLIVGWRDEIISVRARTDGPVLARVERAAARFWGTVTAGAHANGYVADDSGRPIHLWVARRAFDKPTDPGLLDNLVGGGVPHGQTPHEALVREAWEEAGLREPQLKGLCRGRVITLRRDVAEGLQHEQLHVFDLPLPADVQPVNQDGEVAALQRVPVAQALAWARSAEMTVDAALVTLDFALRHRLLAPDEHDAVEAVFAHLLSPAPH
jgi:8-oxo-dGTP pyrophosphatase MutT (NUDIX family)